MTSKTRELLIFLLSRMLKIASYNLITANTPEKGLEDITESVGNVVNAAIATAETIAEGIKSVVSGIVEGLTGILDSSGITNTVAVIADKIDQTISDFVRAATNVFEGVDIST